MEIILKNKRSLSDSFTKTKADREVFRIQLMETGVCNQVYPSGANFILFSVDQTKYNTDQLVEWLLKEHATYIKDVSEKFNQNAMSYFRLAVRLPDENRKLTELIAGYLKMRSNTQQA